MSDISSTQHQFKPQQRHEAETTFSISSAKTQEEDTNPKACFIHPIHSERQVSYVSIRKTLGAAMLLPPTLCSPGTVKLKASVYPYCLSRAQQLCKAGGHHAGSWFCYLLYSVTSVCTEEMRYSGKSCCHGSSTAAAAAAAAAADIPKNAPEEASHRKCHSPKFSRGLLWNLGQEEPQV